MIKFSILIPAFKINFLKECLLSIVNQTDSDFEVIIVDDHSPENIKQIVAEVNDNRIKYYRNEQNCGAKNVVDNWNICLRYASGDFVLCMGDDDVLAPDCLEVYGQLIEKYPNLGVYHTRSYIIDEESKPFRATELRSEKENTLDLIWRSINGGCTQFIGDFLYNRQMLLNDGGFYKLPFAWGSDYLSAFIGSTHGGIVHTNKPLFRYRKNRYTISSSSNADEKIKAQHELYDWMDKFVTEYNPQNEDERVSKTMILDNLGVARKKALAFELMIDMQSSGITGFLDWITHTSKYNISIPLVFYSYIQSLKSKFK